jgi:hypothetical protein
MPAVDPNVEYLRRLVEMVPEANRLTAIRFLRLLTEQPPPQIDEELVSISLWLLGPYGRDVARKIAAIHRSGGVVDVQVA